MRIIVQIISGLRWCRKDSAKYTVMVFRLCGAIPDFWNCLRKACSTLDHQGYDYHYYWAGTNVRGGIISQKANVGLVT